MEINLCGDMEELKERYDLVMERIAQIAETPEVPAPMDAYVQEVAKYLLSIDLLVTQYKEGTLQDRTLEECQEEQELLYGRANVSRYADSYLNPAAAITKLGKECGGLLSAVYTDMLALIPWTFEGRWDLVTIWAELFVMLHGDMTMEASESQTPVDGTFAEESYDYLYKAMHDTLYWFYHDNCEIFDGERITDMILAQDNLYMDIVKHADLTDLRYLYAYGAYIGPNELGMAEFMNSLPQEKIDAMASTYTEGYRIGFEVTRKDLSKKATVKVEYPIGLERMVRSAVAQFEAMGLKVTLMREAVLSLNGRGTKRNVYSTAVNPQMDYDHKNDRAYYLDKGLAERRLEVMRDVYQKHKTQANGHAGPAVIEVFGEEDFTPVNKPENAQYTDRQNELNVYFASQSGSITNTYIPGDERSFTIIAYPLPSIGENFKEIFEKTVELNTLDYKKYQTMQQCIIDVLDQGEEVHILGTNGNETDITVHLHPLADPARETRFENCVADVNIPVGEVFTSPVLEGTNGILHVSRVYLNGNKFSNLKMTFEEGMVTSYTCGNFPTDEENKRYIDENIMFHHDSLPLGEFAIGTNTTAYRMGKDYDIAAKLPILIAEKTGPHFAVGDTCYSHAEDVAAYNPDGKEIIARDNSVSLLRKEDPSKAYLNCHTDITIPFEELGEITAIAADGTELPIIRDGRFVVAGTEELNIPLD